MAIPRWIEMTHNQAFAQGAFLVSDVTPVIDYDRSSGENRVQAADKGTSLPLWQVEVLDGDRAASKRARTVTVKFAAAVQPVPPSNESGMPFTPVVFEELTVLPYIERVGEFGRIAWSFRATGMSAAGKSSASSTRGGSAVSA
ncbi:plasmid replication, integration and excision activator [Mycolicibacter minnesotensis]|uniref:Plasmid replication, integration and excision activator n=1 Tax=Mycolicibacter minnesotensis TaxID=1118379 RepID=A0AA91M392_9MYCO|nr:plasmid replication, integration and excision activator [Mycolicibacter minnesotensis]ORA97886.1 plasmid replication, integration and excision activator [Mycolicibacter minnesotensis]